MGTLVYLICIAVASFAVLAQPAVAQGVSTLSYPGQVLQEDDNQTCPSEERLERVRNVVKIATQRLLRQSVVPLLQSYSCGGSFGWRRVAYLNMSDPFEQCPSVWQEITTPHRVCRKRSNTGGCEGLNYTTGNEQYNQVCGRIIGYQFANTDSFLESSWSIDTFYVDGVSVTHGSPRQHIWTFANGLDEHSTLYPYAKCPCVAGSTNRNRIPSFVGQNYFCETGLTRISDGINGPFYSNGDPLWDGQGCGPTSNCCNFNSPPWFNVQLPSPTTDNIEVRICSRGASVQSPIQLMELYVK